MDTIELVRHITRQTLDWPDPSWNDTTSRMAAHAEMRVTKIIGDSRIIWATGAVEEEKSFSIIAFSQSYIVMDSSEKAPSGETLDGLTRVIPWTDLTGVTLRRYQPAGATASQTEAVDFSIHLADGSSVEISGKKFEGRTDGLELLEYALFKLAA